MAIIGIQSLVFGIEKVEEGVRFFNDFGLSLTKQDEDQACFTLEEGSTVEIRHLEDPQLPEHYYNGPGLREVVFGVDSQSALDAIEAELSKDREVKKDADGTLHAIAEGKIPVGFRLFERKEVIYSPEPVNATGSVPRLNRQRRWYKRAHPKNIGHAVFNVPDPDAVYQFFRDRLNFCLADISKGLGIFFRADGHDEHHTFFVAQAGIFAPAGETTFHHVCFGVEDIDELMAGANHMEKSGWVSQMGLGRHRLSSALFYYLQSPFGGEIEYGADEDRADRNYTPRVWNANFGAFTWVAKLPEFLDPDAEWDVRYATDDDVCKIEQ